MVSVSGFEPEYVSSILTSPATLNTMAEETWKERLKDEYLDLIQKLTKLNTFLNKPHEELEMDEVSALKLQARHMSSYAYILALRCVKYGLLEITFDDAIQFVTNTEPTFWDENNKELYVSAYIDNLIFGVGTSANKESKEDAVGEAIVTAVLKGMNFANKHPDYALERFLHVEGRVAERLNASVLKTDEA